MEITYKDWNIEAMTGYKPITTFYMDFSIADKFGVAAIKIRIKGQRMLGKQIISI